MFTASGTIYRSGGKERIPYATIKASKGSQAVHATSNEGGDFALDIPEPGRWDFVAFEKGSFSNDPLQVDMTQDQSEIKIYLSHIAETEDDTAGKRFFISLLITLGVLIVGYVVVHALVKEEILALSQASINSAVLLKQQIINSQDIVSDDALSPTIADLKNDLEIALSRKNQLNTTDINFISGVVQNIQASIDSGQKERALSLLNDLQAVINPDPRFGIWSAYPLRFLEILFWGLAGILVSKLITTGWWLRSHRFYREGIIMHISHIVATPLLVLVIVLLLSQVAMTFSLANSTEVVVDLSVPTLMAAFAFIIGTSPWPLWKFIQDSARRFTGQLG